MHWLAKHRDALIMMAIAVIILFGCFGRTVIGRKEISKLPLLANDDFFFNDKIRFTYIRPQFDPSLYHFHIPFQLYAAEELKHFRIPLWNQCFGCGFPTFAEPQYCTFSPFRGVFSAAHSYLYNVGIVVKAVIAALGTFALARLLSLSSGTAAFAAFSYGLSPFILRELELPNEMEFFPLIALLFIYCTNKNSLLWRALLGMIAAIFLASMHPEFFFIEMLFATALSFAVRPIIAAQPDHHLQPVKKCLQNLLISGLIAVCLAAPLLVSFIELASNCDSYKFHDQVIQKASIDTFLIGLTTPLYGGGSPFIGVVALLMACFAAIFGGKRQLPLSALIIVLTLWACAPGVLALLVECKPFSFIPPRYLLAPLLLSLTLAAALGVETCLHSLQEKKWKHFIVIAGVAGILAAVPQLAKNSVSRLPGFDGTLPAASLSPPQVVAGYIALATTFLALWAVWKLKTKSTQGTVLALCLCALNLYSLSGSTRMALPPTFPFAFRSSPTIEKIKAEGARMSAAGLICFSPNISLAYGVQDFRATGPIQPRWVSKFDRICYQELPKYEPTRTSYHVPSLLDAASVKYIVSAFPLLSIKSPPLPFKPLPGLKNGPQKLLDSLSLEEGQYCLTSKGELFTRLKWKGSNNLVRNFATQLDIVDASGQTVRQGQRVNLSRLAADLYGAQSIAIKVPENESRKLYLVLRLVLALNEGFIPLNKTNLPTRAQGIELLNISACQKGGLTRIDTPLELLNEDANQLLLYCNHRALPQAYLSNSIYYADSYSAACKRLEESDFDPHTQTIVETNDKVAPPSSAAPLTSARLERPNPNQVIVNVEAPVESYLILTDTFYNGWQAFLDDAPVSIKRANVRFRAVKVPPGKHVIRFCFFPLSFFGGLIVSLVCAATLLICTCYNRKLRAPPS